MPASNEDASILALERPHRSLWTYYLLRSLVFPPAFPILAVIHWFRYETMRYRFSEEGLSMSWGLLFRREVIIQYARIQDIHLHSNVVERWLGLARVQIQTASGNADAEMTLEGFREYEAIRDFLYGRMRGVQSGQAKEERVAGILTSATANQLAETLRQVTVELRELRQTLTTHAPTAKPGSHHD